MWLRIPPLLLHRSFALPTPADQVPITNNVGAGAQVLTKRVPVYFIAESWSRDMRASVAVCSGRPTVFVAYNDAAYAIRGRRDIFVFMSFLVADERARATTITCLIY